MKTIDNNAEGLVERLEGAEVTLAELGELLDEHMQPHIERARAEVLFVLAVING